MGVRNKIRVSRPQGPGMSEQHYKALALPPDSLKHWPDCPGGGQIAQELARLPRWWPDSSSIGHFAQELARLLKRQPERQAAYLVLV
jgi:hypothetical protein